MEESLLPIKQELERRFSLCSNVPYWGFLVHAQSYFNFVHEIPILNEIIAKEEKSFKPKIADLSLDNSAQDTYKQFEIIFWPISRDLPKMIDEAIEAYKANKVTQGQSHIMGLLKKLTKIQYHPKEHLLKTGLKLYHDQLMRRVANHAINAAGVKINTSHELKFDTQSSILLFHGKEVPIAIKQSETVAASILKHIFENYPNNLSAQVCYSEISDKEFGEDEYSKTSLGWKKFYRACSDINEKVRIETGVEDFLLYNSRKRGYVQINDKYVEKQTSG